MALTLTNFLAFLQRLCFALGLLLCVHMAAGQSGADTARETMAPAVLPGKGIGQFDFFYAGEGKARNMYIVRNGKITWSYTDTTGKGEISDAILMANGNILFAHQFGITLINQKKETIWEYTAPDGFETHTAQPIGNDHVVFVQNGQPASVVVMNIKTNIIEKQFPLPCKINVHGQVRHARLTAAGNLLVAHMDLGRVCEYNSDGKTLFSLDVPSVWSAVPLNNGHILVTSNVGFVKEITRTGKVIWEYTLTTIPGYIIRNPQLAARLTNGNTLINNWFNQWSSVLDTANAPVQAVLVTPAKKIIWALRSWNGPQHLGPSTTIQLFSGAEQLQQPAHFGNIH